MDLHNLTLLKYISHSLCFKFFVMKFLKDAQSGTLS